MSHNKRYLVLAVDDQVGILQMIKIILRGSQFDVITATNGEEALAQAANHAVDVVLLDIMMPDVSGVLVCGQLRATPALADVPIVMLTAVNDYALHQRAREVGANEVLLKPIGKRELTARLQALIAQREEKSAPTPDSD